MSILIPLLATFALVLIAARAEAGGEHHPLLRLWWVGTPGGLAFLLSVANWVVWVLVVLAER